MKSILIISFSDLERDPRVHRQILALRDSYSVTTLGLSPSSIPGVAHINADRPNGKTRRLFGAFLSILRLDQYFYWSHPSVKSALAATRNCDFDVILANDLDALPVTFAIAGKKTRIVFDAHEYAPREFEDRWIWRLLHQRRISAQCKEYIPRVNAMTTVCESIADLYAREYGVRVHTITNATAYQDLAPVDIASDHIRMIHHGVAAPSRHPEEMIRLLDLLDDRFSLDFMLIAHSPAYLEKLKALAAHNPRIRFLDPVPMLEISPSINNYDIGLFLLPPVSVNYSYALPNKFFEFLQARLAIAIGPSSEMKRLVDKHELGVISDDFTAESMARTLSGLSTNKLLRYKQNSHKAASQLCAERNADLLRELIENT
jgi:hypothetical protein